MMLRKRFAAALALLLCLTGFNGALAATGQRADFLAQTQNGAYLKIDQSLIRIDGDQAALSAQVSAAAVVAIGDTAYYLDRGADNVPRLMQCVSGGEPTALYTFQATDAVSNLTSQGEELYVLLNDLVHVVYPSNGLCIKLANTPISEFVWLDGKVYCVARDEHTMNSHASLLGGADVVKQGGWLYALDLNTGAMELLLNTGVEDLRAGGGALYFHDLSDNYVMGTADEEWLEGRLYRMDPVAKQKQRVLDGYDWGFYPTADGVGVYTAEGVRFYANDGSVADLLQPQGVISACSNDSALFVFDHTQNVLYCYRDGQLSAVAQSSLGAVLSTIGRTPQGVSLPDADLIATAVPPQTESPDVAETPANAQAFPVTEPPAATEVPATTQAPVATEAPAATKAPSATKVPSATKAPVITAEPTPKPTAKPTQKPSTGKDDSYIFPNSATKKLTEAEIRKVDKSLWAYGRNEIYARHGYEFENSKYRTYFEGKSWYSPGGFSTGDLNSIEWYNMDLLKRMEQGGSTSGSGSSGSSTSPDYIFPNSSTKKLTEKQILAVDRSLWAYGRNEIYARHGYSFQTEAYRKYFRSKSWYKEGGFSTSDLNSIEWYNMELIKKMEEQY